ncbi:MAG: NAD(P)/FAD-dependent oxidoreductase [Microbacteriaceae bacterium]
MSGSVGGVATVDVLVVGGGPVGLAAAIEARLAGRTVTILEPRENAIDKACGEGLMPGALPLLDRLGVHPNGHPLVGVRYTDGRRAVEHRFEAGPGLGVRRTTLHRALHARAVSLGVEFVTERVGSIEQGEGWVDAGGIRASWLLGCDGLHSTVARLVGLALPAPTSRRRFGMRQHFLGEPWTDFIEVHWNRLGEVYVTPTAEGMVGIAVLAGQGTEFAAAVSASPELHDRLGKPATELRGAGPFRQRTSSRTAGRVLLVGDASGYVDAITGEGLRLGFDQARAAVAAIVAGAPHGYERQWVRITRDFRVLTTGLARAASGPAHGAIVPLARALPWAFRGAVERLAR